MPDIELTGGFFWGPIRTGMEQMRAFVSQSTAGIQADIAKMFSPSGLGALLSVGFIEQGVSKIVEYGAKVQDLGNRFGVSTTAIQQFGNVAEKSGSSLESVAMGFNRLDVARSKALGGNEQMIRSFQNLNVSAEDLQRLSLPELMMKLGSSSMNAADMVKILGRNGTELRETLRKLADGTDELGKAIDPKHIKALKDADDFWKKLGQTIKVWAAGELGEDIKNIERLTHAVSGLKNEMSDFEDSVGSGFEKAAGVTSPFAGVQAEGHVGNPKSASSPNRAGSPVTGPEDLDHLASKLQMEHEAESLQDKINKLEADSAKRQRTDQQELATLMQKRVGLTNDMLTAYGHVGGVEADETTKLEATLAVAENQKDIDELTAKIGKEKLKTDEEIQKQREEAAISAEKDLSIAQERNKELQLRLRGEDDLADRAKIEFDYNEKIKAAEEAKADAQAHGYTEVVRTNAALIQQLTLEKQTALAVHDKANAEAEAAEAAKKAAEVEKAANQVDQAKLTLTDLQEQTKELELQREGHADIAQKMHDEYAWQVKIDDATAAANDAWAKMIKAYSDGDTALGNQYAELGRINQALTDQLKIQKEITLEEKTQADNQKSQADNQKSWADGMQRFANNLGSALSAVQSSPGFQAAAAKYGGAAAMGLYFPSAATTLATNPYTGQIDMNQLKYWTTYFQTHQLGGLVAQMLQGRNQQIDQYSSQWTGAGGNPILTTLQSIDQKLTPLPGGG